MSDVGTTRKKFASPVERIYCEWDEAFSRNDEKALLALYAPDGVLESPLIPHLVGKKEGYLPRPLRARLHRVPLSQHWRVAVQIPELSRVPGQRTRL
jgi:hypothetical protein